MRINEYLEYWARRSPDDVCVESEAGSWTFRDLDRLSDRFAHSLARLGIGCGQRIAVVAENCSEWLVIYYGCFKCGVVPVPMNYRLNAREWLYILQDSGARAVLAAPKYAESLQAEIAELIPALARIAIGGDVPGWTPFDDLLAASPAEPFRATDESDVADLYQMYTSGTTGRPKGAVTSHAAAEANMTQTRLAVSLMPRSRALIVMPLYHAGGASQALSAINAGGTIVLRAAFDPAECVRLLDEASIAITTFVPAMIQAMLVDVPDVRNRRYESLDLIAYGASPIAESTLREAMDVFGCGFVQAFGMTECTSVLTLLTAEDHAAALAGRPELLASCGRPVVGTEVRIIRPDGVEAAVGERGEILARGPQLMTRYWNMPEATAEALADGWLRTGDIGCLGEAGYLYVCDRLKDMIVSGGENVYSREVEDVLFAMPGVADAAVIGIPDARWGEAVKAVVVLRTGVQVSDQDVIAWCRSRLAGFKCPKSVDFVDELPRNPSGKVLKRTLREPHWAGASRAVS